MANALLASHKKEAAAAERRVSEQYEAKLREKQKQLNSVQDRLQVRSSLLYSYVPIMSPSQKAQAKHVNPTGSGQHNTGLIHTTCHDRIITDMTWLQQ